MKPNNYIYFFIVLGFFMGLAFAVAKFDEPEMILLWTVITTIGVYIIIMFFASIYIRFAGSDKLNFNKNILEKKIDYFDHEFGTREKEVANIRQFIKDSDFLDNNTVSAV